MSDLDPEKEKALQALSDTSKQYQEAMQLLEDEEEEYWESLTKEQQLMVFCAVVRRLVEGELRDGGSYRYILYQTFGFDIDSYTRAFNAGFMELHNSIDWDDGK